VATVTVFWVLFTYALLLLIIVALSQAVRKLARELGRLRSYETRNTHYTNGGYDYMGPDGETIHVFIDKG
jgi:hypothetical protein